MSEVGKIGAQHGVSATVHAIEEIDEKVTGATSPRVGFLNFLATGLLLVAGHNQSRDDHGRVDELEKRVKALEQRPSLPFPGSS